MSSRLDGAPENTLVADVSRLRADLNEVKSRQSIDRRLVRRAYFVQTASSFDLSANAVPANTTRLYTLTLLGMTAQTYPYGVQFSQVYNNGTSPSNLLSDQAVNDAGGTSYTWSSKPTNIPNRMDWILAVNAGSAGASIYIKFRGITSCAASNLVVSWV